MIYMKKTYFQLTVALMVVAVGLMVLPTSYSQEIYTDKAQLNVSAEQSFDLEMITDEVKHHKHYENHSNETLMWMESLKNKKVFTGREYMVIMDCDEAYKLPTLLATDVIIYDEFEANIIENKSLGDGLKDVLYVKNVEFKKQGIISIYEYNPQNISVNPL